MFKLNVSVTESVEGKKNMLWFNVVICPIIVEQ